MLVVIWDSSLKLNVNELMGLNFSTMETLTITSSFIRGLIQLKVKERLLYMKLARLMLRKMPDILIFSIFTDKRERIHAFHTVLTEKIRPL
jgi:hypothetical protein